MVHELREARWRGYGRNAVTASKRIREKASLGAPDIFEDPSFGWCCDIAVSCPDGVTRKLIFAWDGDKKAVERVDRNQGLVPADLFITARNLAKDRLRMLTHKKR